MTASQRLLGLRHSLISKGGPILNWDGPGFLTITDTKMVKFALDGSTSIERTQTQTGVVDMAYNHATQRLVVGLSGSPALKYSDDYGLTWTNCTLPVGVDTFPRNWVRFHQNSGKFFAWSSAWDASLGDMLESSDGITWTRITPSPTGVTSIRMIAESASGHLHVLCYGSGGGSSLGRVVTTLDGTTWNNVEITCTFPGGIGYTGTAYAPLVVYGDLNAGMSTSSDNGATWETKSIVRDNAGAIHQKPGGGFIVAVNPVFNTGSAPGVYSGNALSFTPCDGTGIGRPKQLYKTSEDYMFSLPQESGAIRGSADGITWAGIRGGEFGRGGVIIPD